MTKKELIKCLLEMEEYVTKERDNSKFHESISGGVMWSIGWISSNFNCFEELNKIRNEKDSE